MNPLPALIDPVTPETSALAADSAATGGRKRGAHLAAAMAVALTLPAGTALADDLQDELQRAAVRRRAPGQPAGRFGL